MLLHTRKKPRIEDAEFGENLQDEDLSRHELVRVYAVGKTFNKAIFKQSVLSQCYFRNCRFVACDFTGVQFRECNLRGSEFDACTFDYCTWDKTQLERKFLRRCLPTGENLARDVARSLRVNFAQIGDYEGVNDAIKIEVRLSREHFYRAAYSGISYYRNKYQGFDRFKSGLNHAKWKFFDLLWGNGESVFRVIGSSIAVVLFCAIAHPKASNLSGYFSSVPNVVMNFWGVTAAQPLSAGWLAAITAARFILFGMFMAILVKRLARR